MFSILMKSNLFNLVVLQTSLFKMCHNKKYKTADYTN